MKKVPLKTYRVGTTTLKFEAASDKKAVAMLKRKGGVFEEMTDRAILESLQELRDGDWMWVA